MQKSTEDYLDDSINNLSKKEMELQNLKDMLVLLEEKIKPIKKEIKDKEAEINKLKRILDLNGFGDSEIITLRLGDLIDELSELSGIDKSDIKASFQTNIYTTGKKPVEKDVILRQGRNRNEKIMFLSITGGEPSSDNGFRYTHLYTPMNFDEIQADGKTLYDHCEALWNHIEDMPWKDINTYLEIYYNIDDIICHLNLNSIMENEEYKHLFYPKSLLIKAVLNCAYKNPDKNIKRKQKSL